MRLEWLAGRGGRHVEMGLGLAHCLRNFVVGPREHVFCCLDMVEHFPDWEAFLAHLGAP